MKTYRIKAGAGVAGLELHDRPSSALGPRDIRVQMRAVSLNARDLAFANGTFPNTPDHSLVPLVDGHGQVIEVGSEVSRFAPGDNVITTYYPHWEEGEIAPAKVDISLGVQVDGTLCEERVASEAWFVRAPAMLDVHGAATLSCAGLTAWNALFCAGGLKPGASVLLLGTGGVSIWALQLAHAAGLRPIVLSSQDEKLEKTRLLGAKETLNYRRHPEWQDEVMRLTEGQGVDLVVEVGGEGTLARSLQACRMGGKVVVIGRVAGGGAASIPPGALIGGAKQLQGITTGSRAILEDLCRFVDAHRIAPVVDRVFAFGEARAAYEHLAASRHFGKVVIDVAG